MAEFKTLDTLAFDQFIEAESRLVKNYTSITNRFEEAKEKLLVDWKGCGADAFKADADVVRTNLAGLGDILKTMCDMLYDCREVFSECDKSLGKANRDALNG